MFLHSPAGWRIGQGCIKRGILLHRHHGLLLAGWRPTCWPLGGPRIVHHVARDRDTRNLFACYAARSCPAVPAMGAMCSGDRCDAVRDQLFSETTPRRPVQSFVMRRKARQGDLIVTCHIHLTVSIWPRDERGEKESRAVPGWNTDTRMNWPQVPCSSGVSGDGLTTNLTRFRSALTGYYLKMSRSGGEVAQAGARCSDRQLSSRSHRRSV